MILTGNKILHEVKSGKINITPFNQEKLTTNSYDLALGSKIIRYLPGIIDPRIETPYEDIAIPREGFVLNKGDFVLGHSIEVIGSDSYVPIIHGKSGTARMGLFVHVTADLIDIGSHGVTTFQLYATLPVRIYAEMSIAQVSFWKPHGEIVLYKGKYQGGTGPQPSMTFKDFGHETALENESLPDSDT